jgi:hypothetical protein
MCASSKDVYPKAIEKFRNPILWVGNQKEGKGDSELFLARSAMVVLKKRLMFCFLLID